MTKQDWRKKADYAYTKDLDNKGWAWEFIRRNEEYRATYAAWLKVITNKHKGDWKNEPLAESQLDLSGLSMRTKLLRERTAGLQRKKTASEIAAGRWGLWAMYDPASPYDPSIIEFDLQNPFPAFYADLSKSASKQVSGGVLQSFIELAKPKPLMTEADIVIVAFDTDRPLTEQLKKTKQVLKEYQNASTKLKQQGKPQRQGFSLYLAMLDALEDDKVLTPGEIIKIIDPHKKFKGFGGYAMVSYKQINKYGEDTAEAAKKFRDVGYRDLLFKIRNTD